MCYILCVILLVLKRLLGVLCLLVGLFALVTPFTPGSWLALVGIELLGLSFLLPNWINIPWEKAKTKIFATMRGWFTKKSE